MLGKLEIRLVQDKRFMFWIQSSVSSARMVKSFEFLIICKVINFNIKVQLHNSLYSTVFLVIPCRYGQKVEKMSTFWQQTTNGLILYAILSIFCSNLYIWINCKLNYDRKNPQKVMKYDLIKTGIKRVLIRTLFQNF
jgi:hypothetical protein